MILTLIGSFLAQVNAFILRYSVDEITQLTESHKTVNDGAKILAFISIVLLLKEVLNAFVQFGQKFFGVKLRIFISRDFSQTIVERILSYKMAFYTSTENDSGKLETRINLGVSSLTNLVQNFFINILPLIANSVVALVVIFNANIYIGIVSLSIIPIYMYISQLQANKLGGFRRRMRSFRETQSNGIIRLIDSIMVIKSFVREGLEAKRHKKIQYDMTENQLKTMRLGFIFDNVKVFVEQIGVVIIIILTSYFVIKGTMTIGAIMFYIMLFNNVSAPIRQLHRIYDEVNDAMIYSEAFFDILDSEHQIETSGDYIPEQIKGDFDLKNIDFYYPNGTQALKNVSFKIPKGKISALIGLSGAGKSTVINLLDKFYEQQSGEILLDNVNLKDYNTTFLRNNIGLVLQRNHIFNGSIAENIKYGNPDASFEDIVAAAKKAYIHDQIVELPMSYESDAKSLSGGQQQRIAIARMFLKNPPVIFLDEPTASLDAIATEQIKMSLDAIKKDRTVIIVSHNLSQIIDAENIIVLDEGRVVEQGTHSELYDHKSVYFDIFNAMVDSLNIDKIAGTMR
ncbi:MAG: ABC transporter ATP-binding protein [Saprospiraceae bacterium]